MKNKKTVFVITNMGRGAFVVTMVLPYRKNWELLECYTRRRDAKRAALRAAHKLGMDSWDYDIKYS